MHTVSPVVYLLATVMAVRGTSSQTNAGLLMLVPEAGSENQQPHQHLVHLM